MGAKPAHERSGARATRLRVLYFIAAVLAALVPLIVFAGFWLRSEFGKGQREIDSFLTSRASALSQWLDAEVRQETTALQAIAALPSLDEPTLPDFHVAASRVVASVPQWAFLALIDPSSGRQVLNTVRPVGSDLPDMASTDTIRRIVETRRPAVQTDAETDLAHRRTHRSALRAGRSRRCGSPRARRRHESRSAAAVAGADRRAQRPDPRPGRARSGFGAFADLGALRRSVGRALAATQSGADGRALRGERARKRAIHHGVPAFVPDRLDRPRRLEQKTLQRDVRALDLGDSLGRGLEPAPCGRLGGVPVLQRHRAAGQRRTPRGLTGAERSRRPPPRPQRRRRSPSSARRRPSARCCSARSIIA